MGYTSGVVFRMRHLPSVPGSRQLSDIHAGLIPRLFDDAGERCRNRFVEFFVATIRNPNTRMSYARAVWRFAGWCEARKRSLDRVTPTVIGLDIEELSRELAAPSVKQHLAAVRMLLDHLVVGHILEFNPADAVKGPKHIVKKGKTPVLDGKTARWLIDTIETLTISGLRDRALIGMMVYSFARIGAALAMDVEDFYLDPSGRRYWFRLREKGGKHHEVPTHHTADAYMVAYLEAAVIATEKGTPLFRSVDSRRNLTERRLDRREALAMIKRRARQAQISPAICCHTFRATGITAYLLNGGTLEHAQRIAAHESPTTTKLYDRTSDDITLDEIERIVL